MRQAVIATKACNSPVKLAFTAIARHQQSALNVLSELILLLLALLPALALLALEVTRAFNPGLQLHQLMFALKVTSACWERLRLNQSELWELQQHQHPIATNATPTTMTLRKQTL